MMNTDDTILFSVLIANYNNAKFLDDAIDSVLAQTYKNWEIILVDDHSTDDSLQTLNKYRADKRIKIFANDSNKGCGFTKARCVELANGTLCGFLDPDDALTSNALEVMVTEHKRLPSYSLINSTHYLCDEQLKITGIADYPSQIPEDSSLLLGGGGAVHHFAAFKKTFYDQTEGISANYKRAVDQDLYYKLEETGPVAYIDMPLYFYRFHSKGISTMGSNIKAAQNWHLKVRDDTFNRRFSKSGLNKTNFSPGDTDRDLLISYYKNYLKLNGVKKNIIRILKSGIFIVVLSAPKGDTIRLIKNGFKKLIK